MRGPNVAEKLPDDPPATAPPSRRPAPLHRVILPQGGEVQVVHVTAGAQDAREPLALGFVPDTAVSPGALFLLVEGVPEPTAGAFARRVHEALVAEQGVAASRLIRAMGTGSRAVERRTARSGDLARFGCTALLLESTLQRYAFISQLPPCQAYVWDGGELTAMPEAPMLGAGQPGSGARRCEVELDVNRIPFRDGATFLLASGALGAHLTAAAARDLLRQPLGTAAGELRRLLRSLGRVGDEAVLVRVPEAEAAPRVRLFDAPAEAPTVQPRVDDVLSARPGRQPGLHKWGLDRERRGVGAWLDGLGERFGGEPGAGYRGRRRDRRTLLLAAGAAGAAAVLGVRTWRERSRPPGPAAEPPATPEAPPAPPLTGRTLLAGNGPLRALTPGAGGGQVVVLDEADRLWQAGGGGAAAAVTPARPGAGQPAGAGLLARREDGLLWLDGQRALWALADGQSEARPLALRDAGGWRRPVAMATFQGNLYILDAGESGGGATGQVWRYTPSAGGGYDAPPQGWVLGDTAFLRSATGFAVDGAIWISRDDGAIVRLIGGRPEPFAAAGLPAPIEHAAAVATAPAFRSLYVLDSGARRLVQLSKAGAFEAEVADVALPEDAVRGLWVEEAAGLAYVLTQQRLQEVPLAGPR